jgi:hypothetical protein
MTNTRRWLAATALGEGAAGWAEAAAETEEEDDADADPGAVGAEAADGVDASTAVKDMLPPSSISAMSATGRRC